MKLNGQYYDALIMKEWHDLIVITSNAAHNQLVFLSDKDVTHFADNFYDYMRADSGASLFLSSQQVKERLHGTLMQWIRQVLCSGAAELKELIDLQRQVGYMHARIGIPRGGLSQQ